VGSAVERLLEQVGREQGRARLRAMYQGWPFFASVIDNLRQVLAKTDIHLAANYAELARDVPGAAEAFGLIESELHRTVRVVLMIAGERRLLSHDPELRNTLDLRAPYLDALSYVQVELLRRKRSEPERHPDVDAAIHVTINGIAAGLRNTG
jgi:phosphoenolpyruvate carboxylase